MIFANRKDALRYKGLMPNLDIALEKLTPEFLSTVGEERVEIKGSDVYCFKVYLNTKPEEETFFENHKEYVDIHVVTEGMEGMGIAIPETLELYEERPETDAYFFRGEVPQKMILIPENFLVAFPEDAHKTCMTVDTPKPFTKIVFKVRL
jgi:biofilm protein TabA